jgi:hypothetical protein
MFCFDVLSHEPDQRLNRTETNRRTEQTEPSKPNRANRTEQTEPSKPNRATTPTPRPVTAVVVVRSPAF